MKGRGGECWKQGKGGERDGWVMQEGGVERCKETEGRKARKRRGRG